MSVFQDCRAVSLGEFVPPDERIGPSERDITRALFALTRRCAIDPQLPGEPVTGTVTAVEITPDQVLLKVEWWDNRALTHAWLPLWRVTIKPDGR